MKSGAKDYNGKGLASFVYSTTYDVLEVKGDRVVIGVGKAITAAVKLSDLTTATSAPAIGFKPYVVKVTTAALNVRKGAGTGYAVSTVIRDQGCYTIVAEKDGWGKLKSGAGWIQLSYTKKI